MIFTTMKESLFMRKNSAEKFIVFLLVLAFLLPLSGCAKEREAAPIPKTSDKMRTYYQIFPYAFADSDGDGIGDINGITAKLDYIDKLHFDGLWLTPVHKSPSYHKYDVSDYYSIDPKFGTLEDYDALVSACHERGMTVLLDLVINHSAKDNVWFERCFAARVHNKRDDPYYNYYDFRLLENASQLPPGWEFYRGKWAYECQFWSGMPDLNLQNVLDEPEGYLAKELRNIMEFWLIEHNIDGFRLDAVTTYFTADEAKNIQFLTWLNATAKALKPDCYIVGEGSWGNPAENMRYQSSGIDSFFAFRHSQGTGNLSYAVRLEKAAYLYLIDEYNAADTAGGIPATFIANHDTGRAYGAVQAKSDETNAKLIYGLMAMSCGAIFNYYGDETGMNVLYNPKNKGFIDEDKRQPMPWGDSYTCKSVSGSTAGSNAEKYPMGDVLKQLKDKNSLLNYVKRANALRRAYPQIARYRAQPVYVNEDRTLCVVSKGEGSNRIYIVLNASHTQKSIYDISSLGKLVLAGTLSVNGVPYLKGNKLIVPPQSFAILKKPEA